MNRCVVGLLMLWIVICLIGYGMIIAAKQQNMETVR